MANLLRLIVIAFVILSGDALAYTHPYYADVSSAMAACNNDRTTRAYQFFPEQQGPCGLEGEPVTCGGGSDTQGKMCQLVNWRHTGTGNQMWGGLGIVTEQTACEDRNNDPEQAPGTRLSLAENSGPKCVAGCTLDVVGDPIGTKPGRVQGQPVVYYQWNQQYTGDTCTGDPDPGDNEQDLEPTETPDGDKQCNPALGVCVDDDGNNEYCTFNPDGTPSQCVPATDYDDDGIPDEDDTMPDDDENGADDGEGDESDNEAGGGAACPSTVAGGAAGKPPTCKGDAIACNNLLQTYLTRCALEKEAAGKITGDIACSNAVPLVCTNLSAAECFTKAQERKAACHLEGVGNAITGPLVDGEEGPEVDPGTAWVTPGEGEGDDEVELDMEGWLSSRSCPTIPSFSVLGREISFSSMQGDICQFFSVGGMIVLLLAAFQCARILGET